MMTTIEDKIIEEFGPIDWESESMGYCDCPGESLHSTPTGARDCRIYLDEPANFYCVHASCEEERGKASARLREMVHGKRTFSAKEKALWRERQQIKDKARRLKEKRSWVLENFAWPVDKIRESSPIAITNEWPQFLSLFDPMDNIWLGQPWDSGQDHHANNFQQVDQWAQYPVPPHHFVCGSTFASGTTSRTKDNVEARRFVIIECDNLDPDPVANMNATGAVLRFINTTYRWRLAAICTSGRKSLHGWYVFPGDEVMQWATKMLPGLGVDAQTMRATQPARVPGILRDGGGRQELIWMN